MSNINQHNGNSFTDEFDKEASEGLKEFSQQQRISSAVDALNKDLAKRIRTKKNKRKKLFNIETPGLYAVIGILLSLIIISFLVIMRLKNH